MNQVIDTTEDRVSEVNSLFTAPTDTDGVSNLNIQDSISDVKELPVTSSVVLNSEASCFEATEKLPSIIASSKIGNQTANETTLPGGSSLILSKSQNIQAKTPNSSTSAIHCALLQPEKVIGTKKHLYMNRLIEGCDLPDGSTYNAWEILHHDWEQIKEQIERRDFSNESSLAADIEPIVNSVLRYPSVERNQKKSRKEIDLPKHMTSDDALKKLKAKEAEKRRLDIAKEAKRLEKLSKTKKAAPPKKRQKPIISSNELKRKSARARKSKKFDDFFYPLRIAPVTQTVQ